MFSPSSLAPDFWLGAFIATILSLVLVALLIRWARGPSAVDQYRRAEVLMQERNALDLRKVALGLQTVQELAGLRKIMEQMHEGLLSLNQEGSPPLGSELPTDPVRPRVVCLCGSTRFIEAFQSVELAETLAGRIVLSIGCNTKADVELFGQMSAAELHRIQGELDTLHLRKIDMADEVFVLNVGGYIGESTLSEVRYAALRDKTIRWLEPMDCPCLAGVLCLGDTVKQELDADARRASALLSLALKPPAIDPFNDAVPRSCRVCGCTDGNCIECVRKTGKPCYWVERDLCSACQESRMEAAAVS